MDDPTGEGRKAKRELSQSKRAAQNRAAQVSFRSSVGHNRCTDMTTSELFDKGKKATSRSLSSKSANMQMWSKL
jgi:hypothetical protein